MDFENKQPTHTEMENEKNYIQTNFIFPMCLRDILPNNQWHYKIEREKHGMSQIHIKWARVHLFETLRYTNVDKNEQNNMSSVCRKLF